MSIVSTRGLSKPANAHHVIHGLLLVVGSKLLTATLSTGRHHHLAGPCMVRNGWAEPDKVSFSAHEANMTLEFVRSAAANTNSLFLLMSSDACCMASLLENHLRAEALHAAS